MPGEVSHSDKKRISEGNLDATSTATSGSPTQAQLNFLMRGVEQPGGKLPLFDSAGQKIDSRTVKSCIRAGWAEPWFSNPIKADWIVCKLTGDGYRVLGYEPPE